MLKLIVNALNMSLDVVGIWEVLPFVNAGDRKKAERLKCQSFMFVEMFPGVFSEIDNFSEYTRSYLNVRLIWYTPCAARYERWSRFFNIFCVHMWISFGFSLVLAVITVLCISNYAHKSHFIHTFISIQPLGRF